MLIITITILMTFMILLIAGYFDLKTGEIPDEVSFGLVFLSLVISGGYSVLKGDYSFLLTSVSFGIVYFFLGYVPFRLGQWGGGDLKLLSGIGCVVGFLGGIGYLGDGIIPYYLFYFVNMGIIAFPYAIVYAFVFSFRIREVIFQELRDYLNKKRYTLLFIISFIPSSLAFLLKLKILGLVYLTLPLFVLASLYLKAFEKAALRETVNTDKLQEGDVLAENLVYDGRIIASKRDMEGLTTEQLKEIQKLSAEKKIPERVTIKTGIKFAPILFIAFLLTVFVGDIMNRIVIFLTDIIL